MALRRSRICNLSPVQLADALTENPRKAKIIDCRSFLEYNDNHIVGSVNICCSKLIKRRLQQDKLSLKDLLVHCRIELDETSDIVIYDQRSPSIEEVSPDSFVYVLLKKLILVFDKVHLLSGGFIGFQTLHPEFTENKIWKYPGLTALSQRPPGQTDPWPGICGVNAYSLPIHSSGPTRILPFLYLGSEEDANNKELLQSHNITYELNVSNKCPKPEFISDGHFMRIPVNDSHNEKLLPYFIQAFQFVDKAQESNESVLIHCLAGISRSPTVAIAYVMRHLQMTCEDAYRYVKAKRATISPNFNFLGQLLEYEKQLIQDSIIEKNAQQPPSSFSSSSSSTSQSVDFVLGPPQPPLLLSSPPPPIPIPIAVNKPSGKRLNLSLRLSPSFESPTLLTSPKDSSPTTAMARLQFDKPPLGKENRSGGGSCSMGGSGGGGTPIPTTLNFAGHSRPTRLVKEQNVTSIQEEEIGQWESSLSSSSAAAAAALAAASSVSKSLSHHHSSVSISISKGFKCRKSSLEQQVSELSSPSMHHNKMSAGSSGGQSMRGSLGCDYVKKFKVHKIHVEGSESPKEAKSEDLVLHHEQPIPSCSSSSSSSISYTNPVPDNNMAASVTSLGNTNNNNAALLSLSPVACSYKREFSRSDSVSTSGIGSEISENELQASGSWEMSESGNLGDDGDGVFSDSGGGSGGGSGSGFSKSPRRQLQLWSSDSGHWSSIEDGMSCSSSQVMDLPQSSSDFDTLKSPEKRKCPSALFSNYSQNFTSHEKRKSYAGDSSSDRSTDWPAGDFRRPKRWSISEDIQNSDAAGTSTSDTGVEQEGKEAKDGSGGLCCGGEDGNAKDTASASSEENPGHLNFDNHWFNLLSGSELTCCERQGEGLLYRVHSCPGFLGCRDWLQLQQTVPDSPPDHEPAHSDSVLLKMRSCCHRSRHERSFEHSTMSHQHPWNKNRFSFGHVDYDELLNKLHRVQDNAKAESSHSSSSTLASSSFSIVVQ